MKKKRRTKRRLIILIIALAIIGTIFIFKGKKDEVTIEKIPYTQLLLLIREDKISSIEMQEYSTEVIAYPKEDQKTKYVVQVINTDVLTEYVQERVLEGQDIVMSFDEKENNITFIDILVFAYPFLMIGLLISSLMRIRNTFRSNSRGPASFPNLFEADTNYIEKITNSNVRFSDVAGLDEEREELIEIVDFLKMPEKYVALGAKIPRGVLLSGAPGTGKTLLAKAIAGEAGVAYLAISGSEFIEKYVGVGASRIRALFKEARKHAPCIIFIDEIDAIGAKRREEGSSEHNQTLEQLLTELDGFANRSNIILLAATNRPDSLDPALTRPGRFDRKIAINLPDVKGREEILKLHGKDKPFYEKVDFKKIAYNTAGFSGAELANVLNESALIAARKNQSAISENDIDEALKKIRIGLKKSNRVISEKEKLIVANHEAGHAIVSLFLDTQPNVKEVSIIPRGTAGGYTLHETNEDKNYRSKTELKEELITLLGGRVAEQIVLNDISTGASNDLQVATNVAREMIIMYGMDSDIGPISFNGCSNKELNIFGDEMLSNIGKKISELMKEAEEKAEELINTHRALLDKIVKELLQEETISGEYLEELFKEYKEQL